MIKSDAVRCARCGKKLSRAYWHGGKPYGSDCEKLFRRAGRVVRVQDALFHDGQLELLGIITNTQDEIN